MFELEKQDVLTLATAEMPDLAREYYQLRMLPTLNDGQIDRLGEILEQAMHDRQLDFWLTEFDHTLGHKLGLLTPERREVYENQRSLLREHMGTDAISRLHSASNQVLPT
jgi:hypothetical protein